MDNHDRRIMEALRASPQTWAELNGVSCKRCKFHEPINDMSGICHRSAPRPYMVKLETRINEKTGHEEMIVPIHAMQLPQTPSNFGCGDWQQPLQVIGQKLG